VNSQRPLEDARQALSVHLAEKGAKIYDKYGPRMGWQELLKLLADRDFVRYPCQICFDDKPLMAGEFAHPVPAGRLPEDGFTIFVHPAYQTRLDCVPFLVLYQLVRVNYGEFATCADAEIFGAEALGLDREEYYWTVCELADEIPPNKMGTKSDLQGSENGSDATNLRQSK